MSLKSVKTKIRSIDKTRKVTKAMEAVSAVKMRKSQAAALAVRPYAETALRILRSVAGSQEAAHHPLLADRPRRRAMLIIISADKGLAGNYGASLLKGVYRTLRGWSLDQSSVELLTVGKKANEHFGKRGYHILKHYEDWSDRVSFADIAELADSAKHAFLSGEVDEVSIAYTNFISTLRQEVVVRRLLPLSFAAVEEAVKGIVPVRGRFAELAVEAREPVKEITYEPNAGTILAELIPVLFNIQLYHSVLEANASEHSARMVAMKNASDNAAEISRTLTLAFNKARQAAITREVSEIVGGMESMRVVES
jgi:F-type H+-transporting ATPase subunit gamma